ncbi:MAG TPA: HlyD family efflux transporter periplasmic adaptor subunit [Longimicrobiales bacterium]|nr:HlyD family efflux transporter periplasmic adaptor subunit [Longimicrobiales bacterium]
MKRKRIAAGLGVILVLALVGWLLLRGGGDDELVLASGTVEATEADLGFQLGGRIASIAVREGDRVTAGAELARLEVAELESRRAAAEAQLAGARALLAELRRGARPQERAQAQAGASATQQRLEEAERVYARSRVLHEGGAISREALDQAETAYRVAQAQHRQTQQAARLVDEGPRAERITAQAAAVQAAEAALAQVDAQLDNARIRAPFGGVVSVRHREPGETVGPGLPVLTVMDPADRWVRIYVREDEVGRVAIGQDAIITADSYPGREYAGRVSFIAGEAEFTPRNVQTAEERVKLVYAVKVAITGDSALVLKSGVPADVRLAARRTEASE